VPLGQVAQRIIKHINLACDALAVLLNKRDAENLPDWMALMSVLVTRKSQHRWRI
jgi:hypothetical protein